MSQILVIPAEVIDYSKFKNGFASKESFILDVLLSHGLFMERDKAETNENFKQIIPYCVVKSLDTQNRVFCYQRNKKGNENRLHQLYSLACGGHLDGPTYDEFSKFYNDGLKREVLEEIGLTDDMYSFDIEGYIYDDSNGVGRVHLGIVQKITPYVYEDSFKIEDTMTDAGYKTPEWIKENKEKFEGWSKIVIENLL